MTSDKALTRTRRQAIAYGLIGGILLNVMVWSIGGRQHPADYNFLFIGSIRHWPSVFHGWLPLDVLETCVCMGAVMYMTFRYGDRADPESLKGWIRYALGWVLFLGSLGGLFLSPIGGWLFGIEGFILFPFAAVGFVGFLAICGGAMFGIGWLFLQAGRAIGKTPFGKIFIRFGRYMNADDVQDINPAEQLH